MKIARPEREEINEAFKLLRALGDVLQGIDPMKTNKNEDDEPVWLEDKDKCQVLDHIIELYDGCNIEWLLVVLDTLISPENKIIDDTADTLEPHPDILRGIADSKRLDWLSNKVEVRFREIYDVKMPRKGKDFRVVIDDAMSKEAV